MTGPSANYPKEYESTAHLAGGCSVSIRPIVPADAGELAEAIRTADADTLRARFLGGPPPISAGVLDRLTNVDYVDRFAVIAHAGTRGVAIARYAALPSTDSSVSCADVAVVVDPLFRRLGLATVLLQLLTRRARQCGITVFTASVFAQSHAVTHLARATHASVTITDGVAHLEWRVARTPAVADAVGGTQPSDDAVMAQITGRITEQYPGVAPSHVQRAVHQRYQAFRGSPIRAFIPILVERAVKDDLAATPQHQHA